VLEGQAKEKGLALDCEVSAKVPPYLCGDTGRILQVLMNLTGNALKFTSDGNVRILVDIIEDEAEKISFRPGEYNVCFRVQDSGIGVRPEAHHKIFEAFVQADPSDSRKYGGSGLGLYLCAKLVKLMQGEIGVYNNPHQHGATFWFILPMLASTEAETVIPSALQYAPISLPNAADFNAADGSPLSAPLRVLVAEDNVINQRVAVKFLEKIGFKADVASDGNQVLAMLQDRSFDLIFMDFQMPVLDGLRCSVQIRDLEKQGVWADRYPIFICGLTANTMSTDKKRCFDSGMNHFISKPFQVEQLRIAIQMAIEHKRHHTINLI
ncbi:histidine kinase, partial [Cavenderia fasciculata]